MSDQYPVTSFTALDGPAKYENASMKWAKWSARFTAAFMVDGETREVIVTHRYGTKRDAAAELADPPDPTDPRRLMSVCFHDGQYVGTSTSYYIGPNR